MARILGRTSRSVNGVGNPRSMIVQVGNPDRDKGDADGRQRAMVGSVFKARQKFPPRELPLNATREGPTVLR